MTKILFIVPPHLTFEDFVRPAYNVRHVKKADGRSYGNLLTDMPLGVMSLSAYTKQYCPIDARLIDFSLELNRIGEFPYDSFAQYFQSVLKDCETPDIVAISVLFSPSYYNLLDIANICRRLFPQAIIVGGGSVCSTMYKQIFTDTDSLDAVCFGEGDRPFLGLVQATDRRAYLTDSPTFITKAKAQAGFTPTHDFVENLDEIPFYDYGLCAMEQYGMNPAITAYAGVSEKDHNAHVMTSLGCPFHCTFCASHKVHGRTMRYYSLQRVREDFLRLRDGYGIRTLIVQDDHFMGDPERALHIVNLIRELGMRVVFQNGLAMYALKREFLEALKDAGVENLLLSIESGSERVLKKIMKKPLKLLIVQRVVEDCRDLGIYTNANIIIGMPGETPQDVEDCRAFLKTISPNWFMIFCASPLVGSEMYEIAAAKGYLKDGYIGSDYKRAVIETEDFSADEVQEKSYALNLELNFVNNGDMRLGEYELALKGFENAIRSKADHAMAYHYAGLCYEQLGEDEKARDYAAKANFICSVNPFWTAQFSRFGINEGDLAYNLPPPKESSRSIFGYL